MAIRDAGFSSIRSRQMQSKSGRKRMSAYEIAVPEFLITFSPLESHRLDLSDANDIRNMAETLVQTRMASDAWEGSARYDSSRLGEVESFHLFGSSTGIVSVGRGFAVFSADTIDDLPSIEQLQSILEDEISFSLAQAMRDSGNFPSVKETAFALSDIPQLTDPPIRPVSGPPTVEPTLSPTTKPTKSPTAQPTPTLLPTSSPTVSPTAVLPQTAETTGFPSRFPTSNSPTPYPTFVYPPSSPTTAPISEAFTPTGAPTQPEPSQTPSSIPSNDVESGVSPISKENAALRGGSSCSFPALVGSVTVAFALTLFVLVFVLWRRRRREAALTSSIIHAEHAGELDIGAKDYEVEASSESGSRLGRILSALDAVVPVLPRVASTVSGMDQSNTSSEDDSEDDSLQELSGDEFIEKDNTSQRGNGASVVSVIKSSVDPLECESFPPDFEDVASHLIQPNIVPIGNIQDVQNHIIVGAALENFEGFSDTSSQGSV